MATVRGRRGRSGVGVLGLDHPHRLLVTGQQASQDVLQVLGGELAIGAPFEARAAWRIDAGLAEGAAPVGMQLHRERQSPIARGRHAAATGH